MIHRHGNELINYLTLISYGWLVITKVITTQQKYRRRK